MKPSDIINAPIPASAVLPETKIIQENEIQNEEKENAEINIVGNMNSRHDGVRNENIGRTERIVREFPRECDVIRAVGDEIWRNVSF